MKVKNIHNPIFDHCPCCFRKQTYTVLKLRKNNSAFKLLSQNRYRGVLEEITPDLRLVKIKKCNNCQHHWYPWVPKFEELMKMYNSHVRKNKKISKENLDKKNNYILKEFKDIIKYFNKDKLLLLDYGSGFGLWTTIAAKLNIDTYAFEPSSERNSKTVLQKIKVINKEEDIFKLNKSFDLINLEQVLEHVINPIETLNSICKLSNKKTIIRIRVPNILRPKEGNNLYKDWPYNGNKMHTLSPYEHIHGFSQKSLFMLCRKAGLEVDYLFLLKFKPLLFIRYILGIFFIRFSSTTIYCKLKE